MLRRCSIYGGVDNFVKNLTTTSRFDGNEEELLLLLLLYNVSHVDVMSSRCLLVNTCSGRFCAERKPSNVSLVLINVTL